MVPFVLPQFTLSLLPLRVVNFAAKCALASKGEFGHYQGFFYPLDAIGHWIAAMANAALPSISCDPPGRRLRQKKAILEAIVKSGTWPFLNVRSKRMGPSSGGVRSFPDTSCTFAIDLPICGSTAA